MFHATICPSLAPSLNLFKHVSPVKSSAFAVDNSSNNNNNNNNNNKWMQNQTKQNKELTSTLWLLLAFHSLSLTWSLWHWTTVTADFPSLLFFLCFLPGGFAANFSCPCFGFSQKSLRSSLAFLLRVAVVGVAAAAFLKGQIWTEPWHLTLTWSQEFCWQKSNHMFCFCWQCPFYSALSGSFHRTPGCVGDIPSGVWLLSNNTGLCILVEIVLDCWNGLAAGCDSKDWLVGVKMAR